MFVFAPDYEFDWPVTVRVPVDGRYAEHRFTARFRLLSPARAAEFAADARALLEAALAGWSGVTAAGGGVLQVTTEARRTPRKTPSPDAA